MHKFIIGWLTVFLLLPICVDAQIGTSSPYSIFGLGELKPGGFTQHFGAGGASISLRDENNFTYANPASYSTLKFTVYNAGAQVNFGKIVDQSTAAKTSSGNFSHFAMAFPLNTQKPMAFSFGVNQYSDVGYEIKNTVNTDTPSYFNLYDGSGGINRLYIGYGIEIFKGLSLGTNFNMNFGNILSRKYRVYSTSNSVLSFTDETFYAYKGIAFDLGVQYSVQTSLKGMDELNHTFGAVLHTKNSLYGDGERYAETFLGSVNNPSIIDTLLFIDNKKDTLVKPLGIAIGYTLNRGKKWALSLETEQIMFSVVENRVTSNPFNDNFRYAAGFS